MPTLFNLDKIKAKNPTLFITNHPIIIVYFKFLFIEWHSKINMGSGLIVLSLLCFVVVVDFLIPQNTLFFNYFVESLITILN